MAFTRKYLKALGIEEEKIDEIIGEHSETVEALKAQIAQGEEAKKQLPELQKQLEAAQAAAAASPDAAAVQKQFDEFKGTVAAEKALAAKRVAVESALRAAGANEKALKLLMNAVDANALELSEKGEATNADAVLAPVKTQFADFFGTPGAQGVPPVTPPLGNPKAPENMTDAEYYAARQKKEV